MTQDDEFLKEIIAKKQLEKSKLEDGQDNENFDSDEENNEDSDSFSGEEESEEEEIEREEDDDQRFIDGQEDFNEKIFENIKQELHEAQEALEGVRPEGNQQRNLDREVGGLEAKEAAPPRDKEDLQDAWDDRSEEIIEMEEDAQEELVDAATSSLRQSFIGDKKRKKNRNRRRGPKSDEGADTSFDEMSHVDRLKNMREDKSTSTSVGDRGRW